MPFHFCPEEAVAILAALPVVGTLVAWLRSRFSTKTNTSQETP